MHGRLARLRAEGREVRDVCEEEFLAFPAIHVKQRRAGPANGAEGVDQGFAAGLVRGAADDDLQGWIGEEFGGAQETKERPRHDGGMGAVALYDAAGLVAV